MSSFLYLCLVFNFTSVLSSFPAPNLGETERLFFSLLGGPPGSVLALEHVRPKAERSKGGGHWSSHHWSSRQFLPFVVKTSMVSSNMGLTLEAGTVGVWCDVALNWPPTHHQTQQHSLHVVAAVSRWPKLYCGPSISTDEHWRIFQSSSAFGWKWPHREQVKSVSTNSSNGVADWLFFERPTHGWFQILQDLVSVLLGVLVQSRKQWLLVCSPFPWEIFHFDLFCY